MHTQMMKLLTHGMLRFLLKIKILSETVARTTNKTNPPIHRRFWCSSMIFFPAVRHLYTPAYIAHLIYYSFLNKIKQPYVDGPSRVYHL